MSTIVWCIFLPPSAEYDQSTKLTPATYGRVVVHEHAMHSLSSSWRAISVKAQFDDDTSVREDKPRRSCRDRLGANNGGVNVFVHLDSASRSGPQCYRRTHATSLLKAVRGTEPAEPMALFSQRGNGDGHRCAALRAAPLLSTLNEASC